MIHDSRIQLLPRTKFDSMIQTIDDLPAYLDLWIVHNLC